MNKSILKKRREHSINLTAIRFAHQLYFNRKSRHLTVKALSKKSGVSMSIIKMIERGGLMKSNIRDLTKLSHALDIALQIRFVSSVEQDVANNLPINPKEYIVPTFAEEAESIAFRNQA